MKSILWNTVLMLTVVGCTQVCSRSHEDFSPEEVVETYLDTALNMTDPAEITKLMAFTTGNLKAALAAADVKTITDAYIKRKYNVKRFSIVQRQDRTPRETEVTYLLEYDDYGHDAADKDAPAVSTENTLSLIREKGLWLIQDVLSNKTSIAFPEFVIRPGAGDDESENSIDGNDELSSDPEENAAIEAEESDIESPTAPPEE